MADPPTRDDQPHILRNSIANFHCAILPYQKIIGIVWKNERNQTLEEYFDSVGISDFFRNQAAERRWRDKNQRKLQERSCKTFDVTFLNEILPMICSDKVAKPGSMEHEIKLKDPNSVEWHLREIKKMRNDVSHEAEKLKDKDFIKNLKGMIRRCLIAACNLYDITNQVEIDQMTEKADEEFETIIQNIIIDKELRVIIVKDLMVSDCISKMKERLEILKIPLPGISKIKIDLTQVFKTIYLSDSNAHFECHKLFVKITKRINIIKGISGSGKSTYLRILQSAIIIGEQSNFEGSNRYRLALLIKCQYDHSDNVGDYLKALFPEILSTYDKDEILDSIRLIEGVIFLIDGYDEANERSRELTNSAIELCSNSTNASCIISSRIKAANELQNDLDRRNIDCDLFSIEKIINQNEQTELIRSYGEQLNPVNKEEAVIAFCNLNQKVKDVFNTPLLLAFFCTLYKTLENKSGMMNEVAVFGGIYKQLLAGITQKLAKDGASDSADTIMDIICEHCLHLIGLGKNVFGKEEYGKLKASCKSESSNDSDMDNLLENVLLPDIPDNILHDTTYSFIHFSIHEYICSEWIEKKLKNVIDLLSKQEFIDLLDLSPLPMENKIERYQNVFRFLILKLHSTGQLEKISLAMSEIMAKDVQPDYQFCLDLISDTECSRLIIEMLSSAIASHPSFSVDKFIHLDSLVEALLYAQNKPKMETDDRNIAVAKSLALNMRQSHDEYEALNEEFFVKLEKLRCSIRMIRIFLDTEFSLGVIVSKLESGSILYISCPFAMSHKLKILEGKPIATSLTFKFCDNFTPGEKKPLPRRSVGIPPDLRITDIPAHCQEQVCEMICSLAPRDSAKNSKTFDELFLARCSLTDSEAEYLVDKLSDKNFISNNEGATRAVKFSSARNEFCKACNGNHREDNVTCYKLGLSRSQYVHHLDLICAADFSETVIKQEEPALRHFLHYEVNTSNRLTALGKVMNFSQQSSAHSSGVDGDETNGGEKSGQIKKIEIELLDSYCDFEPLSDGIFQDLQPVRCSIIRFIGCLDSSFSLNVLKSKLTERSIVKISTPCIRDHKLNILNGVETEYVMEFMLKYEGESLGVSSFPLPRHGDGCPPILQLMDSPAASIDNVCSIISSLAPVKSTKDSRTFFKLFLARCSLTASEAKSLVDKLSAKNFITENEGVTRAVELSSARNEWCEACSDNHSKDNLTCYKLELSRSQYVHHLDLICAADFSETVIKQEEPALRHFLHYEVNTSNRLTALGKVMNYSQQSSAHSSGVDGDETNGGEKSGQIKEIEIKLEDSYRNFEPLSDGIFQDLQPVRCSIIRFIGCLDSSFSLNVLKSKLTERSRVTISTPSIRDHKLNILNGVETEYVMGFMLNYEDESLGVSSFPLPRNGDGCPPVLRLMDSPAASIENVCSTISSLAPVKSTKDSRTFYWLFLARCSLTASEAKSLADKLSAKNFITENEGVTRAVELSSARNEWCEACDDKHSEDNLTCYKLELTRSQYVHHLDLICAADFSETVIKQEEPALRHFLHYEVNTSNRLTALGRVMNYSQQSSAHSSGVDGDETNGGEKSGQIKEIEIKLEDSYRNFEPLSDGIFQDLQPVRCSIIHFIGCLDSSFSLNVLKSKLTERSGVFISTPSIRDHKLNILNGVKTEYVMRFMLKYEGESLGVSSFPLPRQGDGCPPTLHLMDSPAASIDNVCSTISSLAPVKSTKDSSTFFKLFLARCSLTASEAKSLVDKLSAKNFITENEGVTRAVELSSARNELCEACHDNHSEDNLTCYKLELTRKDDKLQSSKGTGKRNKLLNYLRRKMKDLL